MAEDYFADAEEMEAPVEETKDASETKTALLPKNFFGSKELEIGGECSVKIVKIMDDEVQVEYQRKEEEVEPEDEPMAEELAMMEDMA